MTSRTASKSTIFIILLLVQANVAAADPVPSLGMPSNAQAHYDAANSTVEVTWGPPADASANTTFTYEVRKDNIVVYTGSDLSFVDTSPHAVVVYAITAYHGNTHGAAAIAIASPINLLTPYPHCFNLIYFDPLPQVNWDCLFPIP